MRAAGGSLTTGSCGDIFFMCPVMISSKERTI